jgi:hypothetical protein
VIWRIGPRDSAGPGLQEAGGPFVSGDGERLRISTGTLQELLVVADYRGMPEIVEVLLAALDPDVEPVDAEPARAAVATHQRFGKGPGHPAQLIFEDGDLRGHSSWVTALVELPDGHLASGSQDGTIKRWDTKLGKCISTLPKDGGAINCLAVLDDGPLTSRYFEHSIKLWNVAMGECDATLHGHCESVNCLTVLTESSFVSRSVDNIRNLEPVLSGVGIFRARDALKSIRGTMGKTPPLPYSRKATLHQDLLTDLSDLGTWVAQIMDKLYLLPTPQ